MSAPHNPSDYSAAPHDRYIPALDGLRGVAAMLVAGGHYMTFEGGAPLSVMASTLVGLGMTLFFVLSGFVIHYNAQVSRWPRRVVRSTVSSVSHQRRHHPCSPIYGHAKRRI